MSVIHLARNSKISYFNLAFLVKQYVGRLDVSMYNFHDSVQIVKAFEYLNSYHAKNHLRDRSYFFNNTWQSATIHKF